MNRFNVHLTKDQVFYLKNLDGASIAQHIRTAIDSYIQDKKNLNVSTSASNACKFCDEEGVKKYNIGQPKCFYCGRYI